jgi:hypothetical protein
MARKTRRSKGEEARCVEAYEAWSKGKIKFSKLAERYGVNKCRARRMITIGRAIKKSGNAWHTHLCSREIGVIQKMGYGVHKSGIGCSDSLSDKDINEIKKLLGKMASGENKMPGVGKKTIDGLCEYFNVNLDG